MPRNGTTDINNALRTDVDRVCARSPAEGKRSWTLSLPFLTSLILDHITFCLRHHFLYLQSSETLQNPGEFLDHHSPHNHWKNTMEITSSNYSVLCFHVKLIHPHTSSLFRMNTSHRQWKITKLNSFFHRFVFINFSINHL